MKADDLTLFHFAGCSYCGRVQAALRDLGLEVEQRDIHRDGEARAALVEAQGRSTVPVLRVQDEAETRWMPESTDIVRYLYQRFGEGRSPPLKVWLTPQHLLIAVAVVVAIAMSLWR